LLFDLHHFPDEEIVIFDRSRSRIVSREVKKSAFSARLSAKPTPRHARNRSQHPTQRPVILSQAVRALGETGAVEGQPAVALAVVCSKTNCKPSSCDNLTPCSATGLPYLLIPLAAFLAVLPLLINGCSCGPRLRLPHRQLDGSRPPVHPRQTYTPTGHTLPPWNAGEPRFVFYPPISWMIGAILGLLLPWTWTPIAYTWLCLTAAGLAFHPPRSRLHHAPQPRSSPRRSTR